MDRKLTEKTIEAFRRKYGHPAYDWPDVPEKIFPPRPGKQKKSGTLEALDFDTPCNVGPEGEMVRSFENCPDPATWNVEIHHCKDGEDVWHPITLCDEHLIHTSQALADFVEENDGVLPCGKKAESVYDIMRAERIRK